MRKENEMSNARAKARELMQEWKAADLNTPIFIRFCVQHDCFEWLDPVARRGGVADTLQDLKKVLAQLYCCPQCGHFNIDHIYDIDRREFVGIYGFIQSM
jgi:hypothetical protein